MKAPNWFIGRNMFLLFLLAFFIVLPGCSARNAANDAFSGSESVNNNAQTIPASFDTVWNAALVLVAQQGFNIEQMDVKARVITVNKEIHNDDDHELSHTVKATITVIPVADTQTRVMLAANQTTELHKKTTVWWHLLWIIPLIPIDTEYTTVVTDRDTIRSPDFYQDFFSGLLANIAAKEQ